MPAETEGIPRLSQSEHDALEAVYRESLECVLDSDPENRSQRMAGAWVRHVRPLICPVSPPSPPTPEPLRIARVKAGRMIPALSIVGFDAAVCMCSVQDRETSETRDLPERDIRAHGLAVAWHLADPTDG